MRIPRARREVAVAALLVVVVAGVIGAVVAIATRAPEVASVPSATPSPSASPSPSPTPTVRPTPSPTPAPAGSCPFNGLPVYDAALAERVPMLVQIENNPAARPPSGLNLADLVIEAPVEGNTTRFNAVFGCHEPLEAAVGPVRSARYFNVHLWQQFHGLTFVFGGGWDVLQRYAAYGMPYLNGISGGYPFYFRGGSWPAPHNVFLDVDTARAAIEPGGWLESMSAWAGEPRSPLAFKDGVRLPRDGRRIGSVDLYTASIWRFGWEWDRRSDSWLRTDAGEPNFDALTDERLSATTVLVQVVLQDVLWDELDASGSPRQDQHLVGEGHGILYVDGRAHDVSWARPTDADVTTWTYATSGKPVVLPPGRVWWEIVPLGTTIVEE